MCSQVGWRVFPVSIRNGRKCGAVKDWPNRATTDWGQIQEWFAYSHMRCDVGILTGPESGLWVLDIDVKNGINGFASARDLFAAHGETKKPNTFRVTTPSGGEHLYFRYPSDHKKIGNTRSKIGSGLDVQAWHGMVVAPGSFRRRVTNDTLPVADATDWLLDLVTTKARERTTEWPRISSATHALQLAERLADRLARVGPGARNQKLNDAAYELGHLGATGLLDEEDAKVLLLEACRENGAWDDDGPRGLGQCVATFESGWNSGLRDGAQDAR